MEPLSTRILGEVAGLPEGAPLYAKALLHLGSRAAIDQALSRLVRRGGLLRAGRGLYVRPVQTRFGTRAPRVPAVLKALTAATGEMIVAHGAAAANSLGLTTQIPVRTVLRDKLWCGRTQRNAHESNLKPGPASIFHRRNAIRVVGHQGDQIHSTVCRIVRHVQPDPHIHALLLKIRLEVCIGQRLAGRDGDLARRVATKLQRAAPDGKEIAMRQVVQPLFRDRVARTRTCPPSINTAIFFMSQPDYEVPR